MIQMTLELNGWRLKGIIMTYNIEQLAKKHLYTVEGPIFWEAAGYEQFAKEIIEICASTVDHINIQGNGTIGELIRSKFDV